jgi:hypothetical protein
MTGLKNDIFRAIPISAVVESSVNGLTGGRNFKGCYTPRNIGILKY